VLAIRDAAGKMLVGPPPTTQLSDGDRILAVGGEDDLRRIGARSVR